tara:strand:- start:60013 stop:61488 length:1476 start_codon:yes stop_codon:yes gene_type:complete
MTKNILEKFKSYIYLLPLLFGVFIAADDQTVIVTILPELLIDMNVGINELSKASWTITAYLIGYAAMLPIMGNISDKYGWKFTYNISILIFVIGSIFVVLSAFLSDIYINHSNFFYWILIISRFIQAIGAGALIPITISASSKVAPKLSPPIAFGLVGASAEAGGVIGPFWGGIITNFASWEWVFLINIPLVLITSYFIFKCPSGSKNGIKKIDFKNGIIFGLIIITSTIGFSRIGNPDFTMVFLLIVAVILLITFIFNIKSTKVNLIPKKLINFSYFFWANVTHFLIGSSLIIVMVTVPLVCATIYSMTALESGFELLKFTIFLGVFALIGGLITKNNKGYLCTIIGLLLSGSGMLSMSLWNSNSTELIKFISLIVSGSGFGLLVAPITDQAITKLDENIKGSASSLLTTSRILGMIVCLAILTSIGTLQFYDLLLGIPSFNEQNIQFVEKTLISAQTIFSRFFLWGSLICYLTLLPATIMHHPKAFKFY